MASTWEETKSVSRLEKGFEREYDKGLQNHVCLKNTRSRGVPNAIIRHIFKTTKTKSKKLRGHTRGKAASHRRTPPLLASSADP